MKCGNCRACALRRFLSRTFFQNRMDSAPDLFEHRLAVASARGACHVTEGVDSMPAVERRAPFARSHATEGAYMCSGLG